MEKGKKGRGKERNLVFLQYKVNKINQNYNNAVYKWVKSDEFLRGVTGGNPSPQLFSHSPGKKLGCAPSGNQPLLRPCIFTVNCKSSAIRMINKPRSIKGNQRYLKILITCIKYFDSKLISKGVSFIHELRFN